MGATPQILLGRYEVGRLLGAGGMAEVYEGHDRLLARRVAIKILLSQYAHDPAFLARFRREAQSAASLSHPNIVSVFDTGSEGDTWFIVMEYVDGRTLKDIIRAEGALYWARAAEVAADVAGALAVAHARGIVMLTTEGKVKVMDFGIARATAVPSITQTSAVVGTAQYIAPEQAQGLEVDGRTDVYALGCCLYEMVTGQVPFSGPTPVAIAYRHVREEPTPPRALNPDVPPPLERVCLKAMAKRPEDRYQTAAEMQRDLERVRVGEPVTVAGPLPSQQTTQAIGAAGYGEAATSLLGAGGTVAGTRAARYAEGVPEQRRGSLGWVLAAILALVVVGLAAFFITRAVTSPSTSPSTTVTTPTTPPTSAPTTTEPPTTPTTRPPTSRPTTTRPPTTTEPPTTPTTQPPTTPTTRPPTTATTKGITTTSG